MKRRMLGIVAVAALSTALTACSVKSNSTANEQSDGGTSNGAMKTGPGVTDSTITVGVLTPLTGPIGPLGVTGLAGSQLFWDQQNAKGGVCHRQVKVVAKDNQYTSQGSITQYEAVHDDIAAINNLSPGDAAVVLQQQLKRDSMLVLAGSFDATILQVPGAVMPGSPYSVEAINGVSYLMDVGKLKAGDTLGVIAYPSGIGQSVSAGAEAAAKHFGLKLSTQNIDPTATDATAQVKALQNAGAKAIVMGTAGTQVVSAASVAEASGYDVTITATNLLSASDVQGPAGQAIIKHVILTSNNAPLASDAPGIQRLVAAWQQFKPDTPINSPVESGYVMAMILKEVLDKACANNDLTHEGIQSALTSVTSVPSDGITVGLDYSHPGQPASRESFIEKPDANAVGGAVLIKGPYASDFAKEWTVTR